MATSSDSDDSSRPTAPELAGGVELALHVVGRFRQLARQPVRAQVWHQVERGALDFGALAGVIGALAGFFTVVTISAGFGFGVTVAVRVFQSLVLGQLAGFASALLLVAGPGMAAMVELGLMRQNGELRTLRLMGIDPRDFLVLPRVLGFALALFVLTFVFQLASVIGGFALAALFTGASFTGEIAALLAVLTPATLVASGIQNLVLGGVLGVLVCHQGLVLPFSASRMPQSVQQLLGRSLIAIVVVQGLAAVLRP